jgi:hypothetical protein
MSTRHRGLSAASRPWLGSLVPLERGALGHYRPVGVELYGRDHAILVEKPGPFRPGSPIPVNVRTRVST